MSAITEAYHLTIKYATGVWFITFHGWRVKQIHLHVDVVLGVVLPVPIEPAKQHSGLRYGHDGFGAPDGRVFFHVAGGNPFDEFGGIILKSREAAKVAKGNFPLSHFAASRDIFSGSLMKRRLTVDLRGPTRLKSELRTKRERQPVAKLYNPRTEG